MCTLTLTVTVTVTVSLTVWIPPEVQISGGPGVGTPNVHILAPFWTPFWRVYYVYISTCIYLRGYYVGVWSTCTCVFLHTSQEGSQNGHILGPLGCSGHTTLNASILGGCKSVHFWHFWVFCKKSYFSGFWDFSGF